MITRRSMFAWSAALALGAAGVLVSCSDGPTEAVQEQLDPTVVSAGQDIFRFDTFGDEKYWTDTLRMHEVIQAAVTPAIALGVGLKVDADALPAEVKDALAKGNVDLNSTATTIALLKLNAVVGLKGQVQTGNGRDTLVRVGITCALCHSTVDNSFAPGIGKRLDGWANGDLNPGAIVALSPAASPALKAVLRSWGPGMYDPRINVDGLSTPIVIPPAYGLLGVDKETYTAEGPVSYWNAYVAVTQMHGQGNFSDPRIGVTVVQTPDLVTSKLPALRAYQLSIVAPKPAAGSYDAAAADRGRVVFNGAAQCASCHVGNTYTDVNSGKLHAPSETGMDGRYAVRTAMKAYRTTPLRGLARHAPYFHDGSAKTLADVVDHYNGVLKLALTDQQKRDLVEYLKTL
jgi:mono/diheme cytochrome c family protein